MEPKDALVLFFERSNAIQTFWNFYITVVLGVLAFFGYAPRTKSTAIMLVVVFLLFAYVNFKGMTAIARERIEVCQYLASVDGQLTANGNRLRLPLVLKSPLSITLDPPALNHVKAFHILLDLLTLIAILWLTQHPLTH